MLTGLTIELNEIEGQTMPKTSADEATKTKDTTALENLFR